MPDSCCVYNCTNRREIGHVGATMSYFSIPKVRDERYGPQEVELSQKRREKWIANLRRANDNSGAGIWMPSKSHKVCEVHFIKGK